MEGDFNTPLSPGDKKGGNTSFSESMQDFQTFVNTNVLMDVHLRRFSYTWSNRILGDSHIHIRLDRVLISQECFDAFGDSSLTALLKIGSDHNPLVWEVQKKKRVAKSPFRFKLIWLSQEDLQDKIRDWWSKSFKGSRLFQVMCKLRFVKEHLKLWNRFSFGNIFERKVELKINLQEVAEKVIDTPYLEELRN